MLRHLAVRRCELQRRVRQPFERHLVGPGIRVEASLVAVCPKADVSRMALEDLRNAAIDLPTGEPAPFSAIALGSYRRVGRNASPCFGVVACIGVYFAFLGVLILIGALWEAPMST